MSGFYSPILNIASGWRTTVGNAFQTLRRVSFVIEDTFSFGDFDPQINWKGMAATAVVVRRARYLRIFNFLLFSLDISATLAAPFATEVQVTLPDSKTTYGTQNNNEAQGGAYNGSNAGVGETNPWNSNSGWSYLSLQRVNGAAYTAGAFRAILNGFLEVT